MKKTVLFISLLAFGFWGAAAWAQKPKLKEISFLIDGQPVDTTRYGDVTVELLFDRPMDKLLDPVVTFDLQAPYSKLSLPKGNGWISDSLWQGFITVSDKNPPTPDGRYTFKIYGAQDSGSVKVKMDTTLSTQFTNTALVICRKGRPVANLDSLKFGTIKLGKDSTLTVRVRNDGCSELFITNLSFPAGAPFAVVESPGKIISGESRPFKVRFSPRERKTFLSRLRIDLSSVGRKDSVIVGLRGAARGSQIAFSPSGPIDFGRVKVDSTAFRTVRISNPKAAEPGLSDTLAVTSLSTNSPEIFQIVSPQTLKLPPDSAKDVSVSFKPPLGQDPSEQSYGARASFSHNSETLGYVDLSGIGYRNLPPPAFPTFTYAWPYGREGFVNSSTMTICLPLNAEQASQIQQVRWKFTTTANDTPHAANDTTKLGGGRKLTLKDGSYCFTIPLAAKFVDYTSVRMYWYLWFEGVNGTSSYNDSKLRYSSQIYYDITAPVFSKPPSVTAGWTRADAGYTYTGYTSKESLTLCWEASDPSDIVEVRWKIASTPVAPASAADTTVRGGGRKISGNCVLIPLSGKIPQGRWYCYVWLIDGSGNSSHLAAKVIEPRITYDFTPPVAPTAPTKRNIEPNVWFGHANNRTLTLTVGLPKGSRDAALVRWKFKTPPTSTSSSDGPLTALIRSNNASDTTATFSVPFNSTEWCGEGNLYYWLVDSAGNSIPRNNPFAPYKFDMCSPVITRWLASEALGTKNTMFVDTIKIADHNPVNWSSMLYRFGGARANQPPRQLEPISTQKIGDQLIQKFVARIPADGVTTRGIEYTIFADDSLKNRGAGPISAFGNQCEAEQNDYWVPVRVKTVGDGEFRVDKDGNPVAQPNGRDAANYALFSVPFELDKPTPKDVLVDDLGPYDKKKWRFFEYRSNTWVEYNPTAPTISPFAPGRAFFMIVGDPDKVIDSGAGKTVTTVKSDTLILAQGWNLIGNPFNFPIHRDQLHLINSSIPANSDVPSILTYEQRWDYDDIMEPWKGYAIYVQKRVPEMDIKLVICPIATVPRIGKAKTPASSSAQDWTIQISAKAGAALDTINYVGARRAAAAEYDDFDRFEPPMIGEYVSVYIDNASWSQNPMKYTADFRPLSDETYEWPLRVNSNAHGEVALEFQGMANLPAGYEAYLVDEAYGIARNLRRNPEYRFGTGANGIEKSLKLLVGKSETLQKYSQSVALVPKAFALSQNFPNPFAVRQGQTFTAIRYALPKSATVTVEVYNMLGQKVRTLVNGQAQAADYYLAAWDGRDELGKEVTSGVYVYRLLADSGGERFTSTKKLLFVK